jgi:DNA polymerase I-like protein with 3'-5' exonuclease and polymerase domains
MRMGVLCGRIAYGSIYAKGNRDNKVKLLDMTPDGLEGKGRDFDEFFKGLIEYKGEIVIFNQSKDLDGNIHTELRYGLEINEKKFRLISAYKKVETPIIEERVSKAGKRLKDKITYKTLEYGAVNLKAKKIYSELDRYCKKVKAKQRSVEGKRVKSPIDWVVRADECKGVYYTDADNFYDGIEFFGMKMVLELKPRELKGVLKELDYILLNQSSGVEGIRSLDEIFLMKDLSNLRSKKWYIINDEKEAEGFFDKLESYNGGISFDLETTGLNINMFGKYGSPYRDKYLSAVESGECTKKADKVVGAVLTIEENVSYYFPCGHDGFKNLYEGDSKYKDKIIDSLVERVKTKNPRTPDIDYFIRETLRLGKEIPLDVILMERLRFILENKHLIIQNITYEWKCCHLYDITVGLNGKCDDPSIMHKLTEKFLVPVKSAPTWDSDLKSMTAHYLKENQMALDDIFTHKKYIDFAVVPYEHARLYAPADGDYTLRLYRYFKEKVMSQGIYRRLDFLYKIECDVARAGGYVEFYGYRFDEGRIAGALDEAEVDRILLEAKLRQVTHPEYVSTLLDLEVKEYQRLVKVKESDGIGFKECRELRKLIDESEVKVNYGSPPQVADLFYEKLGYPMMEGKTVKEAVLTAMKGKKGRDGEYKYPAVDAYIPYKKRCTEIQKFFGNLPSFIWLDGHSFSSFGLIDTATGRMSSSKPNAQQFPKSITSRIIARKKAVFIDADYSQIEARLMLSMAKDPAIEAFKAFDMDIHKYMASVISNVPYSEVTNEMRSDAKAVTFGLAFGMGIFSMAENMGYNDPTREELVKAQDAIDIYFNAFPKLKAFFDGAKEYARNNMHSLTYFGRVRHLSYIGADGRRVANRVASAMDRQAMNTPIQGTAADVFKISLVRMYKFIEFNNLFGLLNISNLIHDEKLLEVNTSVLHIKRIMAEVGLAMEFEIPNFAPQFVGAGVGGSWAGAKSPESEVYIGDMQEIKKLWTKYPIFKDSSITTLRESLQDEVRDTSESVIGYFEGFNRMRRLKRVQDWYGLASADKSHKISDALLGLLRLIREMYFPNISTGKLANHDTINAILNEKGLPFVTLYDIDMGYGTHEVLRDGLCKVLGEVISEDGLYECVDRLIQSGEYRDIILNVLELEIEADNAGVQQVIDDADYTPSEHDPTAIEYII